MTNTIREVLIPETEYDKYQALKDLQPELLEVLKQISNWLVCAPIATAEDMAQSFPEMLRITEAAIAKATGAAS